jgi:hypothetical protein
MSVEGPEEGSLRKAFMFHNNSDQKTTISGLSAPATAPRLILVGVFRRDWLSRGMARSLMQGRGKTLGRSEVTQEGKGASGQRLFRQRIAAVGLYLPAVVQLGLK